MATGGPDVDVSVVCPCFDEEQIIEEAVRRLVASLSRLDATWELIVVNDGSTDGSPAVVDRLARELPGLRPLGYARNRGRGHALRTGIEAARGDVVVTTEIDLSWGESVVRDLVAAMRRWPDADIVVASPNLPGGGYRNVPRKRVLLSRLGNRIIRLCMSNACTMNTGMTRAYRRDVVQSLPLYEDGKEFHLEVLLKATNFGLRIREIPATLEWQEYKHAGRRVDRKSSSRVGGLILSHTLFSVFANPVRYVWAMSLVAFVLCLGFLVFAVVRATQGKVSVFMAQMSLLLLTMAIVLFVLGVVVKQGNMVQRELWLLQRKELERSRREEGADRSGGDR